MSAVLDFIQTNSNLIILTLAGVVLILAIIAILQSFRLKQLACGKDGKTLEGTIISLVQRVNFLEENKGKTDGKIENLNARVSRSVRGVETIKFNPFKGTGDGGNQSFSTAF